MVRFTATDDSINELSDLIKLLRSPNRNSDKSRNTTISLNIFYFANGHTQKVSGLEIKFLLDTGASCSNINYRMLQEICQLHHPRTIEKSTKVTKTYAGRTSPMVNYATKTFSFEPDGHFLLPRRVWITEIKTKNFLGKNFCQKQVSGFHFDLPGIGIKNPPKSTCYGRFHQYTPYSHSSQIITIKTTYTMHVYAKNDRCWKYLRDNTQTHFPPCSTFRTNQNAVATEFSFIDTRCTPSELSLPIRMEKNKNHQLTLRKWRIGFFFIEIVHWDEPEYQIRSPYELTSVNNSFAQR